MLTRAEATQQGQKFAEKWDTQKHTVPPEGIKAFTADLNALNALPAPQKNALLWAELRGATDGLMARKILPNLDIADNKADLRNCRIVGLTADGDKNSANHDLVVAIGRQRDNASKAENVVILGQDGKFYQARPVKGGYVKTAEVIAQNADELERKYKRPGLTPKSETEKEKPEAKPVKRGNPADLEVFKDDLKSFQKQAPNDQSTAQNELNRLAQEYARLSREQQTMALCEVLEGNNQAREDVWIKGLRASRPQVAIQRGGDGTIRFSAGWSDGYSIFKEPGSHQIFSQKYDLESH